MALQLFKGVTDLGFVDDIGVAVLTEHKKKIEIFTNRKIWETKFSLENADFTLREHKAIDNYMI